MIPTILIIAYIFLMFSTFLALRVLYPREGLDHHVAASLFWPIVWIAIVIIQLFFALDELADKLRNKYIIKSDITESSDDHPPFNATAQKPIYPKPKLKPNSHSR